MRKRLNEFERRLSAFEQRAVCVGVASGILFYDPALVARAIADGGNREQVMAQLAEAYRAEHPRPPGADFGLIILLPHKGGDIAELGE